MKSRIQGTSGDRGIEIAKAEIHKLYIRWTAMPLKEYPVNRKDAWALAH